MLKKLAFSCTLLLMGARLQAQTVVAPTYLETTLASFTQNIYTLNADMVELPGGNQLMAVARDPYPPNQGVDLDVSNNIGGVTTLHISTVGEAMPDLVIANDPNNPGQYILAVVYLDPNQFVILDTYYILGANTTSISLQPFKAIVLNSRRSFFPHIDMLPDFNNTIAGLPSLHKFVITYGQLDVPTTSPYGVNIYEVHGDISSPWNLSPITAVTSGGHCGAGADVAVSFDPATNLEHVYMAYTDTYVGLCKAELLLDASALPTDPPISSPMINIIPFPAGTVNAILPRIEAMSLNPTSSGMVPWVIGCTFHDGTNHQVYQINPTLGGGYNCSAIMPLFTENSGVAVCAGTGKPGGNVCNDNYNIGWFNNKQGFVTRTIDAYTGMISSSAPDAYLANQIPVPGNVTKVPIALSSCSNSGNFMLTAWWNNSSAILYKLKPGVTSYKPGATAINEASVTKGIKLYPNPANDHIILEGMDNGNYRIINISGSVVADGSISNTTSSIDITRLAPGIYHVMLNGNSKDNNLSFVKK